MSKLLEYPMIKIQYAARKENGKEYVICPGSYKSELTNPNDYALKETAEGVLSIDSIKCCRCLLCKIIEPNLINIDSNNNLSISEISEERFNLSNDIKNSFSTEFISRLTEYNEEPGLNKWLYILFKEFGFQKVYYESTLLKEDLTDSEVIDFFNINLSTETAKDQATGQRGTIRADVEIIDKNDLIVIEGKKKNRIESKDVGFAEPLGQLAAYRTHKVFNDYTQKNQYFVLSYDGAFTFSWKQIKDRLSTDQINKMEELFNEESGCRLSIVPVSLFYKEALRAVETGKKSKDRLIKTIKENIIL
jgi:hypothetical protein